MTILLEAYFAAHVLLLAGGAFVGKLGGQPRSRLLLARVALASCVLAPFAMMAVVPPRYAASISGLVDNEGVFEPDSAASYDVASTPWPVMAKAVRDALPSPSSAEPWLLGLCAAAAGFHFFRLVRDLMRLRRLIRDGSLIKARGHVRVLAAADGAVPFSVRLGRTRYIVLPQVAIAVPAALHIVVAHEGQHHRQGDCLLIYATELLRALFFLNPGVHLWRRAINKFQEYSCDEALIGRRRISPHDYGRCLFEVAQAAYRSLGSSGRGLAAASCTVGMTRSDGSLTTMSELRGRIMMLPRYQVPVVPRRWIRNAALALAVCAPLSASYGMRGTLTSNGFVPLDTSLVDAPLQSLVEHEVGLGLGRNHARSTAVVVAAVDTGRILAFAEAHANPEAKADESWATRPFAPGSTVKPFIVAAAIDAGVTAKDKTYDCRAPYEVGGTSFANAGIVAPSVTATDTLVNSVNVCAIKIAQDLGPSRLRAAFQRFGLDAGRPGLADIDDPLQLARTTLGESLPVTMGTMVHAYARLARLDASGAAAVRQMLVEVVKRGTGQRARLPNVTVAGKTGTMDGPQNRSLASTGDAPVMAMFAGFAPAEAPKLVAFVLVEDAHGTGAQAAAPIFREVVKRGLPLVEGNR